MRELTEDERVRLGLLEAGLDAFTQEGMHALADFVDRLELPEPHTVLRDAERYLSPIESWMKEQIVRPDDRVWILTRIGYFIGELLNQRLGGYWFVDAHPDSPYFLQYVVGQFTGLPSMDARVSPFAIAANYVDEPPGRSLSSVIDRAEKQLHRLPTFDPDWRFPRVLSCQGVVWHFPY